MSRRQKLILILIGFAIILIVLSFFSRNILEAWTSLNTHEIKSNVIRQDTPEFNTDETQSSIRPKGNSSWKVEEVQIGKNEKIERLYFYDENIIYGAKYGKFEFTLYRTLNGGKLWERLRSMTDLGIDDIFFVTADEGFIALSKLKPSSSPMENGSVIMKTIDGGKNWETVYSSVNIHFNKLAFNADGIGVVVGRKEIVSPQRDSVNLVLLSKDKGQTWSDVSEKLNTVEETRMGQRQVADFLTNVLFSNENGIAVLSLRGKISNTTDEGKSWSLISKIVDEPDQTGIYCFGEFEDGSFWLAGGTISIEGKWGMLAVMRSRYSWDRYRLNEYAFSDVKFLSDNEVIVCGAMVAPMNFGGANEKNTGVILYSSDSGKNWTIIHESKLTNDFYSFNKLTENKWFVTGAEHIGVILERPQ